MGGASVGLACVFPFTYAGQTFTGCTKVGADDDTYWCSTLTDADGNHVGGQGNWGHCDSSCPIHGEPEPTEAPEEPDTEAPG